MRVLARPAPELVLRLDGLRYSDGGAAVHVDWNDLEEVVAEGSMVALLTGAGGWVRLPGRYLGTSPRRLVQRIQDVQRAVLLGVVPGPAGTQGSRR